MNVRYYPSKWGPMPPDEKHDPSTLIAVGTDDEDWIHITVYEAFADKELAFAVPPEAVPALIEALAAAAIGDDHNYHERTVEPRRMK